ncbi:hypothetical protein P1X14_07685 [Sphingomonas sp. AOB5]|uniref:hypothetical protein n=1 Tax=Sphingomonas sp. AOB5 TaxID=3034017 RepID=UPI0023F6972B|nr:hypothetical protein [Sphingomonas sp. AOB5]MDF7775123.1 hypothetical protein [Sphingomonas sp. AOB5]
MALWDTDLTTEDGALGAAQTGSFACFIAAGLAGISLATTWPFIQNGSVPALVGLLSLTQLSVSLFAGIRMRSGKGLISGSATALILLLILLGSVMSVSIGGIIINAILLVVVINGIRGAATLRTGKFDAEETAEIFN